MFSKSYTYCSEKVFAIKVVRNRTPLAYVIES